MSMEWVLQKLSARQQAIADNVCNFCGEHVLSFENKLSEAEYQISALCQNCQNEMFDDDPYVEDDNE